MEQRTPFRCKCLSTGTRLCSVLTRIRSFQAPQVISVPGSSLFHVSEILKTINPSDVLRGFLLGKNTDSSGLKHVFWPLVKVFRAYYAMLDASQGYHYFLEIPLHGDVVRRPLGWRLRVEREIIAFNSTSNCTEETRGFALDSGPTKTWSEFNLHSIHT